MQRTKIRRNRNRNRINSKDNDRDPFDINKISKERSSKKKSPKFDRDTKHRKKSQRMKLKEKLRDSFIYRLISKDNDQDPFEIKRMSIERKSKKRSEKFDRVQTTIEKKTESTQIYKLHLLRIQIN